MDCFCYVRVVMFLLMLFVCWNKYWLFLIWLVMVWGLMVGVFNRILMLIVGWFCNDFLIGINEIGGICKLDMFEI